MTSYNKILSFSIYIVFLAFLCSCSLQRIFIKNVDYILYWQVSSYFDLSSKQKTFVKDNLEKHFKFLRCTKITSFTQDLSSFKKQIMREDNPKLLLKWVINRSNEWRIELMSPVLGNAETLFTNLNDDQWENYKKEAFKRLDDYRKILKLKSPEKEKKYLKMIKERFVRVFGEIENSQKDKINKLILGQLKLVEFYIAQREDTINNFVSFSKNNPGNLKEKLSLWIKEPFRLRSIDLQKKYLSNREKRYNFIIELFKLTNPEQKLHLIKLMDELIDDLNSIVLHKKECENLGA